MALCQATEHVLTNEGIDDLQLVASGLKQVEQAAFVSMGDGIAHRGPPGMEAHGRRADVQGVSQASSERLNCTSPFVQWMSNEETHEVNHVPET